jgi:hypothetical protein
MWAMDAFVHIMNRVLYGDPSRFTLLALVEAAYRDLSDSRGSDLECNRALRSALVCESTPQATQLGETSPWDLG